CEAPVLHCALEASREVLQPLRGWTDEEWAAAAGGLVEPGWPPPAGPVPELARTRHQPLEAPTDLTAGRAWAARPDGHPDPLPDAWTPSAALRRQPIPINP
ncbi:hypothetical protein VM98_39330, partial [Streptomyces rubellomurinus subsp. indigoferus]